MWTSRAVVSVLVVAAALAGADAAPAADGEFAIEGIADPIILKRRPGADLPGKLQQLTERQAYTDAVYHISAYTRGVPFAFDFTDLKNPSIHLGKLAYQPSRSLVPVRREYRVLESHLVVGRVTYSEAAAARLRLREGLRELPVYAAPGAYHNPVVPSSRTSLHWFAVRDCYFNAIMKHIAKTYGNKPVVKVSGRAYPVRFGTAKLVPAPEPKAPPAGSPSEPAETSEGNPPAAEPATPPTAGEPPAAAPADEAAAPEEAAEPTAAAAETPPDVWDSRQFVYQMMMEVRVQIDDITFGGDAAPAPAAPENPPPEGGGGTDAHPESDGTPAGG